MKEKHFFSYQLLSVCLRDLGVICRIVYKAVTFFMLATLLKDVPALLYPKENEMAEAKECSGHVGVKGLTMA